MPAKKKKKTIQRHEMIRGTRTPKKQMVHTLDSRALYTASNLDITSSIVVRKKPAFA
jgi:hypothetical protein